MDFLNKLFENEEEIKKNPIKAALTYIAYKLECIDEKHKEQDALIAKLNDEINDLRHSKLPKNDFDSFKEVDLEKELKDKVEFTSLKTKLIVYTAVGAGVVTIIAYFVVEWIKKL